jgi:hypothetical protein
MGIQPFEKWGVKLLPAGRVFKAIVALCNYSQSIEMQSA